MAVVKKAKKKEVVNIMLPKFFGREEPVEVSTSNPDGLIGKRLTLNLIEVLPESNKYYTKVTFRIKKVDGSNAFADFDGLELMRDYVYRMVVRRVRRIDLVQDLITKDGVPIRLKSLATISKKASYHVERAIRSKMHEIVENIVKGNSLEVLLNGIFSDEIKKGFIKELGKIYPLRNVEFRKIEIRR